MKSFVRRFAVTVTALTALAAAAAPAALAGPPAGRPVPVTAPDADAQLENLRWTPVRTLSGGVVMMLRVARDPGVAPGGRYFLWNPDTASSGGSFALGDDILRPFVYSWQSAVFRPNTTARSIEVRYGDPSRPGEALVVASATRG